MTAENLARGFQKAIETGWDALWDFGLAVASRIVVNDKSQAAYCLLMNIAVFGKFDHHAIEEMKKNLAPRRGQSPSA